MDPFFFLLLLPTILAYVAAVITLAIGLRTDPKRAARLALLLLAVGLLLPLILYVGFVAVYFAGGGH